MTRSLLILLFGSLLLFGRPANAAKTGSFNLTKPFQDTTRMLSVYVPTDYDSTQPYRLMVCLHGLGDNSSNYRNALVSSLQWSKHFPNTIFVCPEAYSTTADFYDGMGGEAIVDTCMTWAMTNYHIDTADVILQGFSLGGRAALKYGLEHPSLFKGLLLNTPAVQGVKNALNEQPSYTYQYSNASKLPIYVTHGQQDLFYTAPIDSMVKELVLNDAHSTYRDIPGIAHTIPLFDSMSDVLVFFGNGGSLTGKDMNIVEAELPVRSCVASVTPSVLLQNTGSTTLTTATLDYSINGTKSSYQWQGTLAPFAHAFVQLPSVTGQDGRNAFDVQVSSINGIADTLRYNNLATDTFQVQLKALPLPLKESFEGTQFQRTWTDVPAGDIQSGWSVDSTVHRDGDVSLFNFNCVFFFDNLGRAEGLLSPTIDLTSIQSPNLQFDYVFNYLRYTPPYFTQQTDLTDTLEVLISTDCGATWTSLFKKWGPELATFSDPILNPLSVDAGFATPDDSNWRHIAIDLAPFATATSAEIKFNYISGLGGSFNLDNVAFSNTSSVHEKSAEVTVLAYPNPSTNTLIVPVAGATSIKLLDVTGKALYSTDARTTVTIDTHVLPAGTYVLQTETNGQIHTEKIAVAH